MEQSPAIPFGRNGRSRTGAVQEYPMGDDADARYAAALQLVQVIDHNLQKGTHHYYDTQGRLLNTLDEVVHALLTDSLALGQPARAVEWEPVSELAA